MYKGNDIKNTGLRGVQVADTKISLVDGQKGVLIYRGYRIEDLAENATFEKTAYLLLKGEIPGDNDLEQFRKSLSAKSFLPGLLIDSMKSWLKDTKPMYALIAFVSMLGCAECTAEDSIESNQETALRLIALLPMALMAWHRIRNGLEPVSHDPELSHAENVLYQLSGERPDPEIARIFDVCLILHADHSFNASTFACREVASTQADMYASVLAGLAALSGPLHGGANERVMDMLEKLREEKNIKGWVKQRLDKKEKIMGMGHAVYKTTDPRAAILKVFLKKLEKKLRKSDIYRLSEAIEHAAVNVFESKGKTEIKPNVDFYSAPVYHLMGLPKDLYTPIFAVSRISGWCAHILEEKFGLAQEKPALYRPSSEYIGNYCGLTGCKYKKKK
jgi:citrate synthase